jgi:predicted  nucleic acid-binding Zn-ribbon protein
MNKDLVLLVKLQEIDQRIHTLELSKKEFPKELEDLQKSIDSAVGERDRVDNRSKELVKQHKNLETQIEDARTSLKKSEERLNSITTNREYDAVHSEIETHKNTILHGGHKLKSMEDETEKLKKAIDDAQTSAEQVRTEKQPRIDELQGRISSIDSDIAVVQKERDEVVKQIPPPTYRSYENIHKRRKNGRVIGLVSETERICKVCYKVLEPQLVNEIRKGLRIQMCEGCGSILIWHEAANAVEA